MTPLEILLLQTIAAVSMIVIILGTKVSVIPYTTAINLTSMKRT